MLIGMVALHSPRQIRTLLVKRPARRRQDGSRQLVRLGTVTVLQLGGESSRTTEAGRLEYVVAACARDNIGPGDVYETSPDPHFVAQPGGRLPGGVDQCDLAAPDRDAPAWRPSNVDVEAVAGPGCCADFNADYQAVWRSVDLESSDQLSLHSHDWGSTLNRQTGDYKIAAAVCTARGRIISRSA